MKLSRFASAIPALLFLGSLSAFPESIDVYLGTGGGESRGIYRSALDLESGQLSEAVLAAEISGPGFLALHPAGDRLYAVAGLEDGPGVAGFRIRGDASLERFTTGPIGDGGGTHIAVHPSGRLLLTAQYGGGSTALFPLDAAGTLGAAHVVEHEGGSKVVEGRQDTPHPHWCGFSPDGRFAFVPDLGMDGIVIYRVDTEPPSITRHGFAPSVAGGGPRHMRFSIDGRTIYLLNELTLSVTAFAYDAESGNTRLLATTPSLSEETKSEEAFNSASEILVHPDGRWVYSANRGNDSITVYRVNPDTAGIEVVEVEPIRGAWPRNINLDPSGRWLLAAGAHSNTVSVFAIDPDSGRLTHQTRGVINVPGPICVLFVPRREAE